MLYDPSRDIPQLLTISRFKQWVDTQPPEKEYTYLSNCNCALAQYLNFHLNGMSILVGTDHVFINDKDYDLPWELNDLVEHGYNTFGALSKRLEAILV